ncbi:MAG: sulfate transporter, partial [Clostridia bacterium]|nr:sulfate transporter [Clostridia bacterium]
AVWAAGLFTGAVWLLVGARGAINLVAKLARKPVTQGIMLGLGFSFMLEGLRAMQANWPLAAAAFALALLLLDNQRVPAMLALLVLGVAGAAFTPSAAWQALGAAVGFRLPQFALGQITGAAAVQGILFLALPQLPLTLGNAVIGIVAENNSLFPHRRLSEREVAVSTGIMNLVAPFWGGVPMCHGAGGMAGHVRFGARTGGALVILKSLLVVLTLFFGQGIAVLFAL